MARALRRRTTVPMAWIAQYLKMGVTGRVNHAIRWLNKEETKSRTMETEGRRFEAVLSKNID